MSSDKKDETMTNQSETAEPKTTFADFRLLPEVLASIEKMGFQKPTPVQCECYDAVLRGDDTIIMAQTGTGKTAAFGIPIVQSVKLDKPGVQALIMTPTRELALQVSREICAIGEGRGVVCAAVYGGASFTKQVADVAAGARIVAGTPGRILDHIRRGTISFAGLETLVLDEADEMLSMGFEKEISEIIDNLPRKRQTLLFSATIPDDIKRLAGRYMDDAITISVSGDAVGATEISHFVYLVSGMGRPADLIRIINAERPGSAIIFCNTRDETQLVSSALREAGFNAMWINSDMSQAEREKVMAQARDKTLQYLVATDVAARGIDISHLSHVINYTFPESLEVYIHRTGRTGRQGRHGAALSLIAPQDIGNLYTLRLTYKIFPVEKPLPTIEHEQRRVELERIARLRTSINGARIDAEYTSLARRVMQDGNVERLVGALLQWHFAQGASSRQAAPAPAPVVALTPFAPTPSAPPAETQERVSEMPMSSRVPPGPRDPDSVDIYFDAGRKDGLRISALMKEIVEKTGLQRTDVGKVHMLTRSTFIGVPKEHAAAVFEVLRNYEVDGRRPSVEYAEES